MKKVNPILIAVVIMTVIVSAYFLFSIANMISVLFIIAVLVAVMTTPMSSVKEKHQRIKG